MDPIRTEINAAMTKINELYYQRMSINSKPVPVISTGWFGRTTQKNKNKAAADTKARDATLAQVDNEIAELIANLQTLYSNLIEAIPKETKEILDKHKFELIKKKNEEPYYIKRNTNRKIGEYGSGAPIIETDTIILINNDIVTKVSEFDTYQKGINQKKNRNESKSAAEKIVAAKKEEDDKSIIKRYEAKGYIYIPAHIETRAQNDYIAIMQGARSYNVKISAFLKYETKTKKEPANLKGWTEGKETITYTPRENYHGPFEGMGRQIAQTYGSLPPQNVDIQIWTRTVPTGWPETIVVGSDEFYEEIKKIEASDPPEAPQGGKRSKRKTLKKKKRSGKKLN